MEPLAERVFIINHVLDNTKIFNQDGYRDVMPAIKSAWSGRRLLDAACCAAGCATVLCRWHSLPSGARKWQPGLVRISVSHLMGGALHRLNSKSLKLARNTSSECARCDGVLIRVVDVPGTMQPCSPAMPPTLRQSSGPAIHKEQVPLLFSSLCKR